MTFEMLNNSQCLYDPGLLQPWLPEKRNKTENSSKLLIDEQGNNKPNKVEPEENEDAFVQKT